MMLRRFTCMMTLLSVGACFQPDDGGDEIGATGTDSNCMLYQIMPLAVV